MLKTIFHLAGSFSVGILICSCQSKNLSTEEKGYVTYGTIALHKTVKWEELGLLTYNQAKAKYLGDTVTIPDAFGVGKSANIDDLENAPMVGYTVTHGYSNDKPNFKGHWGASFGVMYNWPKDTVFQRMRHWQTVHVEKFPEKPLIIREYIDTYASYDSLTGAAWWNHPRLTVCGLVVGIDPGIPDGFQFDIAPIGVRFKQPPQFKSPTPETKH